MNAPQSCREVAFVDASVADYQSLVDGLPDEMEVVLVAPDQDGVQVMAEWAATHTGYDAIHVLGHGSAGSQHLGSAALSGDSLPAYQNEMSQIGSALTEDGDILLYGCEVANTAKGEAFIEALAKTTGANIAASRTVTGSTNFDGDWNLDIHVGSVTSAIGPSKSTQLIYEGHLGTTIYYSSYNNNSSFPELVDGSNGITDVPGMTLTLDYGDGSESSNTFTNLQLIGLANLVVSPTTGTAPHFNNNSNGFQLVGDTDFSFEGFRVASRANSIGGDTFTIRGFNSDGTEVISASLNWVASGSNAFSTYTIGSGAWSNDAAWGSVRKIVVDYTNDPGFQEFAIETITVGPAAAPANTPPELGGTPADTAATEDVATAIDLSAYNVSDNDGDTIAITLAVDRGTIASTDGNGINAGVTVANSGTVSMTLQGSAVDLNTYLNDPSKIQYTTSANDTTAATLTVTPNDGTVDGTADTVSITITSVNDAPTGDVIIIGDAVEDQELTASNTLADEDGLGTVTYQWLRDGNEITDATDTTYTLTQADVGAEISVRASYTDQQGTAEAVTSSTTSTVANVNDSPAGDVIITGTATENETLTADTSDLADKDGLGTFSYVWKADGTAITGATSSTYTLTQAEVGKAITVAVSYTDGEGTVEGPLTSAATTAVSNVNNAPTGSVTISGDAVEDQELTASNTLADEDGTGTVTYQWLRDGNEITDATGATYTLTQADVGAEISVRASYTDQQSTNEAVTSAATDSVANVNDAPTGSVTISGDAVEDQELTASNTLADEDGEGTVIYQWLRDGNEITDATGATYTLTQADVGAAISVRASYTDQQDTAEAVTSAATESVANVNDAPTGSVTISGDAVEDQELTASNTLTDEDGEGSVSYQWLRDGNEITDATNTTYTLTQADVGAEISVRASYTDQQDTAEAVTSAATDRVANVNDAPTGSVIISGDAVEDQELTASNSLTDEDGEGTVTYQWLRDGNEITDATGETYTLTQVDVGAEISVRASYTDQQGTDEAVTSAATESVANVNDAPTGSVTISGDAVEDQELTASNTLADEDGKGTVTYQWLRDGNEITDATGSTYTLTQADVGAAISVRASYTDDQGTAEAVTSAATESVANVNDAPTGDVIITGDPVEDQTLTASNTLADEDGTGTVTYQWLRDGNEITDATGSTYTLSQADVGADISVRARYTDQQGTAEAVTSAATESVANVNDAPTGGVTISGDAVEDQTLEVSNTLADEDGKGTVTYQWLRDGNEITDATGSTYTLTQADVDAAISVRASYTDQQGTAEAVTSAATTSVANVNDAPIGDVTIAGTATEDEVLTASNNLNDEDGKDTVTYQWLRDGNEIADATGETYTLTQADVGAEISVRASYTDQQGTAEAVTSAATESVANVNDAPAGSVTISGDAVEDQTLTASNTLADEDGEGTVTYQWLRDGNEITDATGATYTLTQADVGAEISVRASYTDQQGTAEAVTSAATGSVANVNDAPTGSVTISGDAVEDQELTASNTLADEDGEGTVIYQWLRDGNEITNATGETYTLTQADVGAAISVRASYTDQQGTAEAVTSAATTSVANVNDAPTGGVTISGEAVEDQELTASNTLADEDGEGTVTYQWLRDGNEITDATGETYTLTQADVGADISVRASYTDQQGTAEAVTSSTTSTVANVNDSPVGDVIITGTATENETLTADTNALADEDGLGTFSYVWKADDTAITGATSSTYTLTQAEVGKAITVAVSYTDGEGTVEGPLTSAATTAVSNVNNAPTGSVTISGDAVEDQELTASNTLADEDGLGTVTYQWLRDGTEITDATGETYTLTQADVGAAISVRASYTDQQGTAEAVTSAATTSVANVNDAPAGSVTIAGTATEDEVLTASNTLADEDGEGSVSYQWLRDGNGIPDATGATYTLTQADVSADISVRASYTDDQGTAEAVTSAATDSVANVNDAPTGSVTISGDAVEDQTLEVSNTLADEDGKGTVTYQWLRDGNEITNATGATYTLTQADVGAAISVRASYTDQQDTAEAVTSAATDSVANVNDAPMGSVTISGEAVEDQELTASNTLTDEDGEGTVTYQWLRDGNEITDATGSTYTLSQADVGADISVRARYTDQQGTAEAVTSAATESVANVNDAPTGGVTISGDAVEDQTLEVSNTLADEDGKGTVTYQWLRDGNEITNATGATYTLTQADVGAEISVRASYIDDQDTAEAVTSAATASVANVNDAPTGSVTISGDAVEDQELTASNTLADEDGEGSVSYQWLRDGNEITDATGETYTLTQADVGAEISVRASYTDQQGTAEAVTSSTTSTVANVNDSPVGDVIITGTATENETLTADTNALADEDGLGTFSYVWKADGTAITGATNSTYTLTQAEVGKAITVAVSYTDGEGTVEGPLTSAVTTAVSNVNNAPTGSVTISGDAVEDQELTASNTLADEDGEGTVTYQWLRDGNEITDATGSTYTLTQADVDAAISVRASYTDQQGTAEAVTSAATTSVANVNDAPIGDVTIAGTATEDEVLTASNNLNDEDGKDTVTYQWLRDGNEIADATGETYTLTQADVGAEISVRASYIDDQDTAEAVTSAATESVSNVNDAPIGDVTIAGTATEDEVLTASNNLNDEDGLGTVTYQWLRDGNEITDATNTTYTLTQADVGAEISVRASYTDQQSTNEAVTSAATDSVANVNDAPTGSVTISGDAVEDQELTASNTLADEDGEGTVIYQWLRDGNDIPAATGETYTLTQADVGSEISVRASYTDQQGTDEAVTSAATESVANVNDAPTGDVIITGDPVEDQTLTASNTLADEDGTGTVTYQWLRDGNEITDANNTTYTLTQADVGAEISVRASYIDDQGTAEAVTSAATTSVANVNDAPAGSVTISGDAVEDQELTASNTLADEDGEGTVIYQWLRDGNEITDATGATYTLTQADVGAVISVRASYTDQQDTAEAVTSAATTSVANVNDAPTGSVTISGEAVEDQELTASNTLADEDGKGTVTYQWLRDGNEITDATGETYTLTQADVGAAISVRASYTDQQDTAEAVTSAATDSVANVNDAPMGSVTISGEAVEDQELTASNTLTDEDGEGTVTYQWLRDGNEITDATGSTYTLSQADVGADISVRARYTDQQGTAEAVTSAATESVANVNDAPTGGVTISGDAVEDQTLEVSNTLADEDGKGTVTYQWLRDGNEITDATGETYTLTQADVGAAISVRASYTDQQDTAEAVTSAATDSVANVNDAPMGSVTISGEAVEDQELTASNTLTDEDGEGTVTYQWLRDGNEITDATGSTYTLSQADVGADISVRARYTDQQGTAEAVTSAATESVANVNDAPTGGVTISGDAVEDQTLEVSNTLADEDGKGTVTYQWLRDGNEITNATGATYTLTQADVGAAISVRASYTDQQGTDEAVTSAATESVANVNDAPTGDVIITGDPVEDQTLTASNTLADEDGTGTVTYQWLRDGNEITDATNTTYTLTQADVGAEISVRASYTDQQDTAEAVTSAATDRVANVNDAPAGSVTISGDAVEDQTLTASNTLADEDGKGTVSYQWLRDDNEITDATGETYTLTQADVGADISVRASYTDQQGTAEAVTSAATESVANVNDAPTGGVTISGDAVEDQELTASNTLADEDGTGTVTYQWLRDGNEITDATGEAYTLTQADVGAEISVRASYTDQQGTAEAVTSAATESVSNVNDAPAGSVTISGDAVEDQELTASNTLADEDGEGTVIYQWLRDGNDIPAATGETYTLTQADVGSEISVRASYTDQQGTDEAVTSAATESVANVNDAPTGDVIITGDPVEDQTLTASNNLNDEDGLGTVTYQWLRDGNEITNATGSTYTLTQADVGAAISVRASYTDQQGTAEAVTSAATDSVANVNDAPTGDVIITGDAVEDQTLTASNTLADEDGKGTVTYQWLRDGNEITDATGATYTLTQADVGADISVRASYTDQQGTDEAVTSAATESVANVNDAPAGSVTISGDAVEDQELTASNTLADEDGEGTVTYQWLRDGNEIADATGETYTLTQADVGADISVRASYTDQQGTAEAIASVSTSAVSAKPESDNDGVSNEDESRVPSLDGSSTGDGNGDSIADAEQSNVSSTPFLLTPTAVSNPGDAPETFITLTSNGSSDAESDDGLLTLRNVRQLDAPSDRPDDLDMPFGLIAFEADIETVGGSNVFSLFVAGDSGANGYWKQNAAGDWVNLASAAFGGSLTNEGNKLRFDFVIEDGGEFDSDGIANGVIADPGAIGFRSQEVPEPVEPVEPIPDIDDGGVNSAPIARDDAFSSRFGWLLRGNLLEDNGNGIDQEIDGDNFSITDIDGQEVLFDTELVLSSGATLIVQENGDFLYDQKAAFVPSQEVDRVSDTFEYSLEDSQGASSTAAVSVELGEVTDTVEISVLHALYKVAFDREADATGLDYWSAVREEGVSMFDIADFFIESEEFTEDHSTSLSDDDYLTLLYANAFDRAPDADGFAFWSEVLEEPTVDHGDVMTYFATSEEMQVKYLAEGFIFA